MAMLASQDRYARDVPLLELTQALNETTACLGVYRTYIRNLELSPEDQAVIEQALAEHSAQAQLIPRASLSSETFFYYGITASSPAQREARLAFVSAGNNSPAPSWPNRFEDTFLYVLQPLVSLNEVGGDPRPSAASPELFHELYKSDHRDGRNL